MEAWLCLLPKKPSHPKSPGDLRPVGLLDPLGKEVLLAIKLRVHPKVSACLHEYPQFAVMVGRSTHHALYRVLQHCRDGRTLAQNQRPTLIDKFHGACRNRCQGAFQISLDHAKAFHSMDRCYIKPALTRCGLSLDEIHIIEQWHAQVTYHVQSSTGGSATIPTNQGIRQGCPIAPTLWAAYMFLLMDAVREKFGEAWLLEHLTRFADDTQCGWLFKSETELQKALSEAAQLLHLLVDMGPMGLTINDTKSASLLTIGGTHAAAIRKRLFSTQSPKIVLEHGGKQWKLPIVRKRVYLGACISYHSFEDDTLDHRIKQACASFTRLRTSLLSKLYMSVAWRFGYGKPPSSPPWSMASYVRGLPSVVLTDFVLAL